MPRKQPTTLAECNAELELAQKQLRQYQNREKVLTRKLFVEERRIRTHRLCARGGYLESIAEYPPEERHRMSHILFA